MDFFTLFGSLQEAFADFNAGVLTGFAAICYIVIQAMRGKFGDIPYVTKWLEKLPKEVKTYVILGFFGVAGGLTGSVGVDNVTFWTVLSAIGAGVSAGALTIGFRSAAKQGMEGIGALKKKLAENKGK